MRRSTSPAGPLVAIALLCLAVPARANDTRSDEPAGPSSEATSAGDDVAAGGLRGSVDPAAWSFLEQRPAIEAEDLPAAVASAPADVPADNPLSADERDRLGAALLFDGPDHGAAARKLRSNNTADEKTNAFKVSRTKQADGVSTVVLKKPIAPDGSGWKAHVGADLGMASEASVGATPDNPLRVQRDARGANAAWASVDVHQFATVDARVSPASEQGMLATTLKRSLPIGSYLSMTLQSRTSMTESYGRGLTTSDIPLMALPATGDAATPRVWGQENSAKLNIAATGTSFGAGVSASSTDAVMHNTLSAEQQLYGPLSVSTSVTDAGQAGANRAVRARARFSW